MKLAILGGEPVRRGPFSHWPQYRQSDIERLVRVVESRRWGGFPLPSPLAADFADRFAAMHGARYGLCVANGTVAIVVALQAAGIRFGDEVIVPAYTWDGTAAAVLFAGGVPVFADVDPDTYCLDVESARHAITPRTKAIIPVHLAMRFTDMDRLLELAAEHELKVIEDCAHAHGGAYKDRGAGSMGDIGCFSFQESKLMTSGEGGIVITSRLDYYEAMQSVVNCGRASLTDQFGIRMLGSNYRMTELQAALLIGQLEMLPDLRERRTRHAALLTERLSRIEGIRPLPEQAAITHQTYYNYVFQYRAAAPSRDVFAAALEREGIPCDGRFYEPVYRSDLFYATPENCPQLRSDYAGVRCRVSERAAYDEAVWLPQFLLIGGERDVEDVARAVEKVTAHATELAQQHPSIAGVKGMPRGQRGRVERGRNY
ncbi:MAG TPA: DegT/DnrJ/EryC1/StrS family aminotransferase [Bryobacteraceae bacterium]|nr:DegT/DnrJ/EryC1/StrS family aminotransferase [Bryobacteraceae bacterium]